MMRKQNFVQGAFILVIAGLITRGLGTIYRIFLSRIIGPEAIGLYQMAFPTMIMLITFVTAGLPIAVSKLVAEAEAKNDQNRIRSILRTALLSVFVLSIFISVIFALVIPLLAKYLLTDERVALTLTAIIPIIPIISFSAILRGYFQGKQNMIPSAASTIIETIFRMISGMYLSYHFLPFGVQYASFGAMIGMVIGEIAGFLTLFVQYAKNKRISTKKKFIHPTQVPHYKQESTLQMIAHIAVPVTTSQIFGSLAYFFEPSIVAHSLSFAGLSAKEATILYGQLAGMAILIITFPSVITYSLSVSLIPAVSEAAAKKDIKSVYKRLHQALKIAYLIGLPSAIFMYVLANPLALFLFDTPQVGHLIKIMSPFAIFLYLQRPLSATLQGLDKAKESMTNTIIGAIVKSAAIILFASRPQFGIDGVALAISMGMVLVTILHFRSIYHITGYTIEIKPIFNITISSFIMGYIAFYMMNHNFLSLPLGIRLLLTTIMSAIAYFYLLLFLKIIKKQDIERIPWLGSKMSKIIP